MVMTPAVGVLREAERVLASGLQDRLTDRFRRDVQAILLEEAAQAAVDLYSGRLKASDAEIARAGRIAEYRDRALAPEQGALRIVVVGQRGVGKSALINALLGSEASVAGEPTLKPEAHDGLTDDTPCRLIDTPGIDGTERATRATAALMADADLVLWVHRATRPSRAADAALAKAFAQAIPPEHRAPPVIHVATGADQLLSDWPRPENALTRSDSARLQAAMKAIGAHYDNATVIPVRGEAPDWNIPTLRDAIDAAFPDARRTRRSRLFGEAAGATGFRGNLRRAGRGIGSTARALWGRIRR
jgi:predicted GTPase